MEHWSRLPRSIETKTKPKLVMLQKQFTPEQEAIISDWVRLYSKGKSIDFGRVQTDDAERWRLMSQHHGQASVRAKVYYHRMTVTKDIEPKPSLNKKYVRGGGGYQCRKCDFKSNSKQSMGSHYRFSHPRDKASTVNGLQGIRDPGCESIVVNVPTTLLNQFVIVSPNGEVRAAKLINHCPSCGESVRAHIAASNI